MSKSGSVILFPPYRLYDVNNQRILILNIKYVDVVGKNWNGPNHDISKL